MMIFKRDDSETDYVCHKGESLKKVASETPEKFYIPLERYTRVTENMCFDLNNLRAEIKALKDTPSTSMPRLQLLLRAPFDNEHSHG
jgi:hypothetical protein